MTDKSLSFSRDGPSPEVMIQSSFSSLDRGLTSTPRTQAEGLSPASLSLGAQVSPLVSGL